MTRPRNPVPDLMKGIAVLAMIQVHIMELFARAEILEGPAGKLSLFLGGPFAAPVFMAVMGYFLAASTKTISEKLKRGFFLILLGFLLNIGLNLHLLLKIFNGTFDLNPLEYIFGADILFLAGNSIIIISLVEKFSKKLLLNIISLALLIPLVSPFLPDLPENLKYVQAFFYGNYSWSYFPLLPWLSYPLLGYGMNIFGKEYPASRDRLNQQMKIILAITGLIFIILFIPAFSIITNLQAYYHHHIFLFTWILCFLVIFTWSSAKIEEILPDNGLLSYIKWLGKNVTIVYAVQWLIIGNIATAIYMTQAEWMLILWFAMILAATSAITKIILKLKKPG